LGGFRKKPGRERGVRKSVRQREVHRETFLERGYLLHYWVNRGRGAAVEKKTERRQGCIC